MNWRGGRTAARRRSSDPAPIGKGLHVKGKFRGLLVLAAVGAFSLGCLSFFSADRAYEESGRWFARATYNAQCSVPDAPGCAELSKQQPNWPYGVEVSDQDVLLAQASAFHNTGSGVLALAGLFVATAGALLAGAGLTGRSGDRRR